MTRFHTARPPALSMIITLRRDDVGVTIYLRARIQRRVGRLPQALIEGPQALLVQPFVRLGSKLAITDDFGHTLNVLLREW